MNATTDHKIILKEEKKKKAEIIDIYGFYRKE